MYIETNTPARRWRMVPLAIAIAVSAAVLSLSNSARAQAVGGWRYDGVYYPTAELACRAQWQVAVGFGITRFIGAFDSPGSSWSTKHCSWTTYQYLAPQETGCGVFTCSTVLPSLVSFNCPSGYTRRFPGKCVLPEDDRPERQACYDDNGSYPNPTVGNPIVLSSGAKILQTTDFSTADGKFVIGRSYRSNPVGKSNNVHSLPLGLTGGWAFDFAMEVQLGAFSGSPSSPTGNITVVAPDGSGYDFTLQADGTWIPRTATGTASSSYRIEFVGTLPTALADVPKSQSHWRIIGPDNRTWEISTLAHVNRPADFVVGQPSSVTDADGYSWTYSYGADGRLNSITDTFGRSATFTWNNFYVTTVPNVAGSLPFPETVATIALPDGSSIFYSYDPAPASSAPTTAAARRLVGVDRIDSGSNIVDSTTYHYEDANYDQALTGVTDNRNVRVATYAYDSRGRAVSSGGADGADLVTVAYSMDGNDSLRTVTNALGKQTIYRFAAIGGSKSNVQLTAIDGQASAHCPASAASYAYVSGRVSAETDEEGRVTQYVRDSQGRPTIIRQAAGTAQEREIALTWDASRMLVLEREQPGLTTTYTYDTAGRMLTRTETDTTTQTLPYPTNGQTRTWSWTYTANGQVATRNGPLPGSADTVTYSYNSAGDLQAVTDELGHVTTIVAVNGRGQPTEVQDPNGLTTIYAYDAMGRPISSTADPSGVAAVTSYEYDEAGNMTRVTSPDGAFLAYTYDDASRVETVTDNLDNTITYTYDDLGNVTRQVNADDQAVPHFDETRTYDELGRLLTLMPTPGAVWTYGYDKVGNQVSVSDPNSNAVAVAFDALNRVASWSDEESSTTSFGYDQSDEPATETDPRTVTTTYVRNGWGEVIEEESPDTGSTVYQRNALGLVTSRTDARGAVANTTYDAGGRITAVTHPAEPAIDVAYGYDSVSGGNAGIGRLTSVTDAAGSVAYRYDLLGRLVSETRQIDSASYTTGYQYDAAGNVSEVTYPSGRIVGYERHDNGDINGVWTEETSLSPRDYIVAWAFNAPFGPLVSMGFGNGLYDIREFREDGSLGWQMLENGSLGNLIERRYIYWDDRNLTQIVDIAEPANTQSYWYWENGAMQSADGPWGTFRYNFDGAGNRLQRVFEQGSTVTTEVSWTPWGTNRLAEVETNGVVTRTFTSDAAGNITDDVGATAKAFTWNADGQLAEATVGGVLAGSYQYDHMRRLVSKLPNLVSPKIHYLHDQFNNVIAEYDSTGVIYREYIWLEERPLAVVTHSGAGSSIYYVHTDHLPRPVMLTDASKAIVWQATYLPFGELYNVSGPLSQDYRFPGQWFQAETGLHYNWNRHFDPTTGRYLQPDPLGMIDGNRWAYAGNSPLMYSDFEGLSPLAGEASRIWRRLPWPRYCGQPPGYAPPPGTPLPSLNNEKGQNDPKPTPGDRPYAGATPADRPGDYDNVRGRPGLKNRNDGSYWEKDRDGHGGSQWKRWPSIKDAERKRGRQSVRPDGSVR